MLDGGVPEQIHRFITSPPQPQPPLPPHQPAAERSLPFPIPLTNSYTTNHHHHMLSLDGRNNINIHHHHHHHHHDIKDGTTPEWISHIDQGDDNNHNDHYHHYHHDDHPWCSDEVLALLRFRSTVENWFPEFTWDHTSRKLAEVGFKRSPQECKEKFEEEERRYFNSNNNTSEHHIISNYNNKGNNYKMFSEIEEFYHNDIGDEHVSSEVGDNQNKRSNTSLEGKENVEETRQDLFEENKRDLEGHVDEVSIENRAISIDVDKVGDDMKSSSSSSSMIVRDNKKNRKRSKKGKERFCALKGVCESLVKNLLAQQEEMHKKLLEDMSRKEEESMAKEEAWKKQEIERLNKELENRAQEQAMVSERNTNIIKFISKFTEQLDHHGNYNNKVQISPSHSQDSSSLAQGSVKFQTLTPHNPLIPPQGNEKTHEHVLTKTLKTKTPKPKSVEKSDIGKRWSRDEVLALINIRRSISSMNDDHYDHNQHKDVISSSSSSSKAVPLWERISKKMLENGYKRSAKRCKEKWENINKYFRKTKDVNKKRPLDSRTCPYFHQLTALYSQPSTTDTSPGDLESRPEDNRVGSGGELGLPIAMHVDDDEDGAE